MGRVEYGTDGYPYKLSMSTGIENTEQYPTVEAIPKDQYEARLKADLVAVLTELQLECEENSTRCYVWRLEGKTADAVLMETINEIIQQKIDKLKEGS